jgi:hypothetical protein
LFGLLLKATENVAMATIAKNMIAFFIVLIVCG